MAGVRRRISRTRPASWTRSAGGRGRWARQRLCAVLCPALSLRAAHGAHATHKFVYNRSDIGELYDLVNDPWEMRNLIDLPEAQELQRELMQEMREHMVRVGDPILEPVRPHPSDVLSLAGGRSGRVGVSMQSIEFKQVLLNDLRQATVAHRTTLDPARADSAWVLAAMAALHARTGDAGLIDCMRDGLLGMARTGVASDGGVKPVVDSGRFLDALLPDVPLPPESGRAGDGGPTSERGPDRGQRRPTPGGARLGGAQQGRGRRCCGLPRRPGCAAQPARRGVDALCPRADV